MNENSNVPNENLVESKKQNNYLPILIGIVVLIIIVGAIGVGYLFIGKTPDKIFEGAIHQIADKMIKQIDENIPATMDLSKNDFSLNGKIKFDTSVDFGEMELLKDYTYNIETELSIPKQILKLNLGLEENAKEILKANIVLQDNNGYLNIPDVLPYTFDLGEVEWPVEMESFENIKFSKEDYKEIVNGLREAIIATINPKKITVNKNVNKDYNGKNAETTEYVYKFDKENQQNTVETFTSHLKENESFKKAIQNILKIEEQDIDDALDSMKENFEFQEEVELVVTTTGAFHEAIEFDLIGKENKVSYIDYNGKETFAFDNATLEITKDKKETTLKFDYQDYSGTIVYNNEKSSDNEYTGDMKIDLDINGETFNATLSGTVNYNANISKENIQDARSSEDLTPDEALQLYTNLSNKLKGTSLEKFFNEYLAGTV